MLFFDVSPCLFYPKHVIMMEGYMRNRERDKLVSNPPHTNVILKEEELQ
jgi:hypothetical protein